MDQEFTAVNKPLCPYCSDQWNKVYHYGGSCPNIVEIEYHQNGAIKKIVTNKNGLRETHNL